MQRIELNDLISEQSRKLFQLDDLSLELLAEISVKGPNTAYGLGNLVRENNQQARMKSLPAINASHATITRRLQELTAKGFLFISKEESYRIPGQTKKYYSIEAKGFLASLSKISIDRSEFGAAFGDIERLTNNSQTAKLTIKFFKLCLATWFEWHVANGLFLTNLIEAYEYRNLTRVPTLGVLGSTSWARRTSEDRWRRNVVEWLRDHPKDKTIFENCPPHFTTLALEELPSFMHQLRNAEDEEVSLLARLVTFRLALGLKLIKLLGEEDNFALAAIIDCYQEAPQTILGFMRVVDESVAAEKEMETDEERKFGEAGWRSVGLDRDRLLWHETIEFLFKEMEYADLEEVNLEEVLRRIRLNLLDSYDAKRITQIGVEEEIVNFYDTEISNYLV